MERGTKVFLWCDGLKVNLGKRQKRGDSSEHDDVEEVEGWLQWLGKMKTRIRRYRQLLIHWSQSMVSLLLHQCNRCTSRPTYPSNNNYVVWAGGGTTKKTGHTSNIGEVVSQAITQLTSALSPKITFPRSPAKVIENRSKQLSDLKNLHESGVQSDEEYWW